MTTDKTQRLLEAAEDLIELDGELEWDALKRAVREIKAQSQSGEREFEFTAGDFQRLPQSKDEWDMGEIIAERANQALRSARPSYAKDIQSNADGIQCGEIYDLRAKVESLEGQLSFERDRGDAFRDGILSVEKLNQDGELCPTCSELLETALSGARNG